MLRVAVLLKQVPKVETLALGPDGRLVREGLETEINPYCRRAVSKGVELARGRGGRCTAITLGPPAARDALREAVAWGADEGVHVCDPAFAGSDTLATARALAATLEHLGGFDLVMFGRNSVDADTGQVGPAVAQLLGLPFVGGVREVDLDGDLLRVRCEHDDGWARCEVALPAAVSAAERLCEPAKVKPDRWSTVPPEQLRVLSAADLGAGPWGQAGSPTRVGAVRTQDVDRACRVLSGPVGEQVAQALALLRDAGALDPVEEVGAAERVPAVGAGGERALVVLAEPERDAVTRELLGAAARLAHAADGRVVVLDVAGLEPATLGSWGADEVVPLVGSDVEEDVAAGLSGWAEVHQPWAVLVAGTLWGREVSARAAARLGAGLTGDAIELGVEAGRLVCGKPAFGGRMVAAIYADSPVQMATVRPGVLPTPSPREASAPRVLEPVQVAATSRLRVLARGRDDDLTRLAGASVVIGVGTGVPPEDYPLLEPLRAVLGAELAATRKVTDRGWLPRDRQVGLTGRAIAPRLYVALGVSGKYNHMVGVRGAGTVLAVNADPQAFVFDHADIGVVGDWREVVAALAEALQDSEPLSAAASGPA